MRIPAAWRLATVFFLAGASGPRAVGAASGNLPEEFRVFQPLLGTWTGPMACLKSKGKATLILSGDREGVVFSYKSAFLKINTSVSGRVRSLGRSRQFGVGLSLASLGLPLTLSARVVVSEDGRFFALENEANPLGVRFKGGSILDESSGAHKYSASFTSLVLSDNCNGTLKRVGAKWLKKKS